MIAGDPGPEVDEVGLCVHLVVDGADEVPALVHALSLDVGAFDDDFHERLRVGLEQEEASPRGVPREVVLAVLDRHAAPACWCMRHIISRARRC